MKTNPELVREIEAITRATIELNALLAEVTNKPFKRTAQYRRNIWVNICDIAGVRQDIATETVVVKKPRKEKTSEKPPTVKPSPVDISGTTV